MTIILEKNTRITVMRGNPNAVARMGGWNPGDCAIPVVSVYELFTGVTKLVYELRGWPAGEVMNCTFNGERMRDILRED